MPLSDIIDEQSHKVKQKRIFKQAQKKRKDFIFLSKISSFYLLLQLVMRFGNGKKKFDL